MFHISTVARRVNVDVFNGDYQGDMYPPQSLVILSTSCDSHSICFAIVDTMLICGLSYNILNIGWYLHLG